MLGTVGQDVYTRLVHALTEGDSVVILKTIDDIIERGKDLALFLRELTIYFRNLLIARLGADAELIDLPEEELAAVKEISGLFEHHDLIRIVHDLSDLESRFRQLPSPRVSLEMLLLRIAQLGADVSIDNLISKLTTLEKRFRGNTAGRGPAGKKNAGTTQYVQESDVSEYLPEKESASDDPVQDGEESPESFGDAAGAEDDEGESQMDLWRQFADEVRVQRMSIYSFLNKGRFCGIRDGEVIICFDEASRYNKTHLEQKEVRMLLEEILKTVAGTPLRLKMIIESAPAAAASTQEPKQKVLRDDRAEATAGEAVRQVDEIRKNPVVQKTVELFKGKIVYVSG
jgi:DNA polymerase-3 subunit gamma/tau